MPRMLGFIIRSDKILIRIFSFSFKRFILETSKSSMLKYFARFLIFSVDRSLEIPNLSW